MAKRAKQFSIQVGAGAKLTIHQCLTARRASGDINIHRHNPVASPDHTVTIMVVTPAIRTAAHANDPSRFRHLVVHLAQGGSHLVSQGARNDHDI